MGVAAAQLGAGGIVLIWFVVLSAYDIRQRRLPNALTLPGALAVFVVATATGRGLAAFVGAAALALVYLAVHVVMPRGLGAGDVKLALGVGALTASFGVGAWVLAALAAPLLTSLWAVVVAVARRQSTVPHGPSMCLSAVAAIAVAIG
jgi:leader peptidase (prepilin peptidase) / N-methyltransferase